MMRLIWLTGMLLGGILLPFLASGQEIGGTVKDSTGAAVPYANVNLKRTPGDDIVAYTTTDSKGVYLLQIPANTLRSGLYLEVRCIGYKTQSRPVVSLPGKMDFTLAESVSELQAVIVHSTRPVLKTNGDTLSYKVASFAEAQDRVIGDVIKRLPGISVAADGTISYNNKPVSAVYLGGDNLLDDRYNIATNSIPQGVVDQVQVIDNDQPVKVLQHKVNSNDVALNLTFKKSAKLQLFGQQSIGAGLPGNYDADLNAMLFSDKFKAIDQLKGNNTGYDLQRDLVSHNASGYRQLIGNDLPQGLLSLGSVNNPDLARNRYLFNRAGVLNVNSLVNLKNDWQLRVNAFYLHDSQKQDYSQHTTIFLPGDTVNYAETQHNHFNPDLLHAQFNILHNTSKNYLSNVFQLDDNRSVSYSELNTNGALVSQKLIDHSLSFSNEFNVITSSPSNHIIQFYSYISHFAEPEKLAIGPDYQPALFNNGNPYAQLTQNTNVPTWYTNDYLSYKIPGNLVTQSFRTGFSLQSQSLTSGLNPGGDSTANHLNWNKRKFYAEAAYDIPGDKLKANVTLPLTLQQISYADTGYMLHRNLARLYFNPQLQLKYYTYAENFVTLLYSYRNQAGTIEDVYQGDILKNYRALYANSADLTLQQNHLAAAGFNYRKTLTLFFWSVNLLYNHTSANNIASSIVTNNLQRSVMLPYPNSNSSWTMNGSVSKYSFVLQTTFSGELQWQSVRSVQIQNNVLLPFSTISKALDIGTDTKLNDLLNFSYKANFIQTNSRSAVEATAFSINQLQQQASVNYNPSKILQFRLSGEHYFTRQQGNPDLKYFFADASAKFRVEKWKTDLELNASNFLNVKTYNALYLSANTLTANSYTLPGRIVLLKVLFNL